VFFFLKGNTMDKSNTNRNALNIVTNQPSRNKSKSIDPLAKIRPMISRKPHLVQPLSRPNTIQTSGLKMLNTRIPSSDDSSYQPLVTISDNDHSDEEDPLSLTFSSPGVVFPCTVQRQTASRSRVTKFTEPSTRSRDTHSPSLSSRSSSRASRSQVSRQRTLDEELRDIPCNHSEQLEDEAVLTGVGIRSKQLGFLAHGGAGGAPVFMGVGYVEAAEDDVYIPHEEANIDDEYLLSHSTGG